MDILILEGDWMDAQKHGFVPMYHEGFNNLYFEKPGVVLTDYCPCSPISERGQQYIRVYAGARSAYYKTHRLFWFMNYARPCPKCGGIMEKFETLAGGVDDTEFDVEQCIDCGYYE